MPHNNSFVISLNNNVQMQKKKQIPYFFIFLMYQETI